MIEVYLFKFLIYLSQDLRRNLYIQQDHLVTMFGLFF